MPGGLNSTDRKLLVAAAALAFLMAAATVTFAPATGGSQSKVPSSYSSGPAGALAAYLLLEDLHYPVRRWEQPPASLPATSNHSVLILAEPTQMPLSSERASLLNFVRSGGRVLFCGDSLPAFFPKPQVSEAAAGQEWTRFSARLPSLFTRGARNITMDPKSFWTNLGAHQLALYGEDKKAVAVVWKIGSGELLWWAAPTPLANAGIAQTDNLKLFLDAVAARSPSAPLDIYWDEYFHGEHGSLWSYVAATPLKWGLIQLALLAAVILFTFSRRSGPTVAPRLVSRLSPLEFVETLGGLYQRAGATSVATGIAYRHLRLNLTRRLALPSGIPDAALARSAAERLGWNSSQFTALLDGASAAQTHNLRPQEALALVGQLGQYTARLEPKRAPLEKH